MTDNTVKIANFFIENGTVKFQRATETIPAVNESVTNGNVTHNTIRPEVPGVPAFYEVTFPLRGSYEVDGIRFENWFTTECRVTGFDDNAPYRVVEDAAARQLPAILRMLADKVEQSFAESDAPSAS